MNNEIGKSEVKEVKNSSMENFKNIKPEHSFSPKEVNDYWKNEFHDQAEQAKTDIQDRPDNNLENSKQDIYKNKNILERMEEYFDDLKSKSECPDTIPHNAIDITKLEVQSPDETAKKRDEFDTMKAKLRKEWEKINHREWPKYKEDVVNEDGKVIRKAGDNYDAHHIQPLKLGGENVASNITPLDVTSHKEIHSTTGSCRALVEGVKGGSK